MSISSYTHCFHYTNLLLFSPIHLTSVMFLYHILFSPLSYICFPVSWSPRNFWVIWLPFHLDNCHHPVSALSGRATSDPRLLSRAGSCTGMGLPSPSPVCHWPPVVSPIFALPHCSQTAAATMEWCLDHPRTSGSKQDPALGWPLFHSHQSQNQRMIQAERSL